MPLADLTNLTNHTFVFDPTSIFAVNEQPGPGGPKTTFVWKVFNEAQAVAGTPADFLNRHSLNRHFVQLKGPRGELWVRADAVSSFHAPFPGDQQPSTVHCMLSVAGFQFTALDDVQTVRKAVEHIPSASSA
jgi:hypothetical protein